MKNSVNGTAGDHSIDNFNHQPYPSTDPAHRYHVPNYDDLFIVQRSIEMVVIIFHTNSRNLNLIIILC